MFNKIVVFSLVLMVYDVFADNRSNQMNPNNSAYSSSHGVSQGSGGSLTSGSYYNKNNRSNQMNPNNSAYYSSRGIPKGNSSPASTNYYNKNNHSNQMNSNNSAYYSSRGILKKSSSLINNQSSKIEKILLPKSISGDLSIKTKNGMDTLFIKNKEMSINERFIDINKIIGFYDVYLLELNPGGSGTTTYYQFLLKNKKGSFNKTKSFGFEGDLKNVVIYPEKNIILLQFSKHYFKYDKIPKDKKLRDRIIKTFIYKNGNLTEKNGDLDL